MGSLYYLENTLIIRAPPKFIATLNVVSKGCRRCLKRTPEFYFFYSYSRSQNDDCNYIASRGIAVYLECTLLPSTKATGPVYLRCATNTKWIAATTKIEKKMTEAQLKLDAA